MLIINLVIKKNGAKMEVAFRRREQEVWQACDDLWALHGDLSI